MRKLVRLFKTLSDETRLRILNILMLKECCVCEVMQALDISQSRASRNLSVLYNAGLLNMKRDGLWVIYSINRENISKTNVNLIDIIEKELLDNASAHDDRKRLQVAVRRVPECCIPVST